MEALKIRIIKEIIDIIFGIILWIFTFVELALLISPLFSIIIVASIVIHEYGHYVYAKREGIYKGYRVSILPCIKLTKTGSRRLYFAGFVYSLTLLPVFSLLGSPLGLVIMYVAMMLVSASLDFLVIIFYGRLKHDS